KKYLNFIVEDIKKRWKNIRDTYMKLRKKLPTGSASLERNKWPLMPYLSFLNMVEYERNSITNIAPPAEVEQLNTSNALENIDDSFNDQNEKTYEITNTDKEDHILSESSSPIPEGKKRSRNDKMSMIIAKRSKERNELLSKIEAQNNLLVSQISQEEDDVDIFFKSIAMTIKKLPRQAINEAKIKTLTLVNQLENNYSVIPNNTLPQNASFYRPTADYINSSPINTYTSQSSSLSGSYEVPSNSRGFMPINYDSDDY
ncbi:transcription factor Adf-1-like, partial [Aphis craccivora]